ncbi:hypothetical protein [Desulfotomaculum nigrificans]|nr:hypothetical protein [Desulfotomaculum nigrificans]
MTGAQFAEWAQQKIDACNVFNEIETSKVIVEIMKKYFSLAEESNEEEQ